MNRIFTVLIGLCLFPLLGTAQTYLNEDFSTSSGTITPPAGWTNVTVLGDTAVDKWRFDNPANRTLNAPISSPAAIFDSDFFGSGGPAEDVLLTSPTFNASAATVVNLEFDHYFQGGFGGEYFVESFDGTGWDTVLTGTISTLNPQHETIDISASAAGNANAQVRFRWNGNYSWYWILDNVLISSPAGADIGVVSVDQPGSGCGLGAAETVSVTVQNFGGAPQSTFDVSFQVDGGTIFVETSTATTIPPGGTGTYTFSAFGANLSALGPHTIKAWTTLTGDGDASNDTTTVMVDNLSTVITPAYTENFDSYSNGTTIFPEFTNDPNADVDFQVNSGTTTSTFTGPTDDVSGGGKYIYTEVSGTPAGTTSRLVSGCIDLAGTTAPQLIFSRHLYGGDIDSFEVDVLHAGNTTNILKIIGDELTTNSDPFITDTFDLTAYAGQSIQIAFSGHTADFDGDIALDEIVIKEFAPLDVTPVAIEVPASGCGLDTAEQVTVSIFNAGTQPASNFVITLGVIDYTTPSVTLTPEFIAGPIAPGDTLVYTFTAGADLSIVGAYEVGAITNLTGDGNPRQRYH